MILAKMNGFTFLLQNFHSQQKKCIFVGGIRIWKYPYILVFFPIFLKGFFKKNPFFVDKLFLNLHVF